MRLTLHALNAHPEVRVGGDVGHGDGGVVLVVVGALAHAVVARAAGSRRTTQRSAERRCTTHATARLRFAA